MQTISAYLKKEWKTVIVALWMAGVTGYLIYLNGEIAAIRQLNQKLVSTIDSVESVLIGTDGNVAEMKKQVDDIASRVAVMHKRVMRRR